MPPGPTYQQDLWHYTIARMVDACVDLRRAAVLRPVRRHRRHDGLRGPVPQRLPARLRRGVEPAPGAGRDRQARVQPAARGRRARPPRHRGDGRRHRRRPARREDGGRRLGQAVQGRDGPRRAARRPRPASSPPPTGSRHERRPLRPRRSVLYMPSSNAKALDKAKTIPCDAIIFDLEDAVAPDAKPAAREAAAAAVGVGRVRPPRADDPLQRPGHAVGRRRHRRRRRGAARRPW